mgnify:FL=1
MNSYLYLAGMPGWAIPLVIVGVFGLIVLAVILIKKHFHVFQSDEKVKSDKEIAQENLDKILEPIDDLKEKKDDNDDLKEE